jgi:hypothetical protein
MSDHQGGAFRRVATHGGQVLNWVAFAVLFVFVGIAIIN